MNLLQIHEALNISYSNSERERLESMDVSEFSIDSRQVQERGVFVALTGEQLDGHDYVLDAIKKGAIAIIAERPTTGVVVTQWIVPNALQALITLATFHRQMHKTQVIALTGSNGKTTVKEMIAAILPPPAIATRGNLNNHIGVPLSVLRLKATHHYAVFELGANHLGEIAENVAIVKPQVALINNIGPAHIEGFGSMEGIAKAKGEIYQGLEPNGIAVINDDDDYAHFWDSLVRDKKTIRFSMQHPADVYAHSITLNEEGCGQFVLCTAQGEQAIKLHVPGRHNINNAVAAAACTSALGLSLNTIREGLQQFSGVRGRLTYCQGQNQAMIIDDTYNANLRSVLSAIDVLAARSGTRIFAFGDMGELGIHSEDHHHEVGKAAREKGIEILMTYGKYSKSASRAFGEGAQHYTSKEELAKALLLYLNAETTVLVKGSRASAMEHVVERVTMV